MIPKPHPNRRAMVMLETIQRIKEKLEEQREDSRRSWLDRSRRAAYDDSMPVSAEDMRTLDEIRHEFNLRQARIHTAELIWHAMVEVYEHGEAAPVEEPLGIGQTDGPERERERREEEQAAGGGGEQREVC